MLIEFNLNDIQPLTFDGLIKDVYSLYDEGATFENWERVKAMLLETPETVKAAIRTQTIETLSSHTIKDKKESMVKNIMYNLLQWLVFSDSFSYSHFHEKYEDAIKRRCDAQTPEQFEAYKLACIEKANKRKAERAQLLEAIKNPVTLEDFHKFLQYKTVADLTPEQLAAYDELKASSARETRLKNEAQRSTVEAVEIEGTDFIIKESVHTKKNIPLWVVQLTQRVDRDKYNELNRKAKQLGGYYSSYTKDGAIPGFIFDKQENAQKFAGLKESDQSNFEHKQERKEAKQLTKAEALREKGTELIEKGEEELNRDRLANTHRRAAMAASAEARAQNQISFGKTLVMIADGIEAGTVKYLDVVSNKADIEELQNVLAQAKYEHIRAENLKTEEYKTTSRTADFAKFPFPIVWAVHNELYKMQYVAGKKMAAARMIKRLGKNESIEISTPQGLEDYETLYCTPCNVLKEWETNRYKERLMRVKRLQRMKIESLPELRAILRELIEVKQGAKITPEQQRAIEIRELERKFINRKIDGFFPTPEDLAARIVRAANIQDSDIVLEPSAGLGHLAEAIQEANENCSIECYEINTALNDALKLKGFEVVGYNFLDAEEVERYDKIIMNPPFENLQDIDHVFKAWKLLKQGGTLVAIMAANKQGNRSKIEEFRTFVEDNGGRIEENPAGSFLSAFRTTAVNTITVILHK